MAGKIPCPVCHGRMKYRFRKFGYRFFQCRSCRFAKFDPAPDEKEIRKRYSNDYFSGEYLPSYGASPETVDMDVIHGRFDFIEQLVHRYHGIISTEKNVLDIGCGAGFLLKIFKDRGWNVLGMDIIDSSIRYGEQLLGIPILKGNFEVTEWEKIVHRYGFFSLVTVTDTLEHFFDPFSALKNIYMILKDKGVLFISVPNIESISFKCIGKEWAIISPLEHISYFSPCSLKLMLEKCGFKKISIYVLQYVNLHNIHKKNLRYQVARAVIYAITRLVHLGFEGRESYPDVLNDTFLYGHPYPRVSGDILFAMGQKIK